MPCLCCATMDCDVEEGILDDFEIVGEEALDFQASLDKVREVEYTEALYTKLAQNSYIQCSGTPDQNVQWFSINIGCGPTHTKDEDIAVHFNVRMPQCYVVRNTRRHLQWGYEETTSFRSFPFKIGRPFVIEALIEEKESLWAVDGELYCTYRHRTPSPLNATWIQVKGIRDALLHVGRANKFPAMAPFPPEVPFRFSCYEPLENEPAWKANVMGTIPNGIVRGQQVVVVGKLRPILYEFTVDLLEQAREWPKPHVHLHVSVRPYDEAQHARQLVVLNSWFGAWGLERRQRTARLVPGSEVTLRLVCDSIHDVDTWSVYANDTIIGEMELRVKSELIRAVRVRGDITPTQIFCCPAEIQSEEVEGKKSLSSYKLTKLVGRIY